MKAKYILGLFAAIILVACTSKEGKWTTANYTSLTGMKAKDNWRIPNEEMITFTDSGMMLKGTNASLIYTGETSQNLDVTITYHIPESASASLYFNAQENNEGILQGYNVKLGNNAGREAMAGSLTGIRNMYIPFAKNAGINKIRTIVTGDRIRVWLNDALVIDYRQPDKPYRTDETKYMVLRNGLLGIMFNTTTEPIHISELNIKLPDENTVADELTFTDDYLRSVTRLHTQGYPMIDYHIHLKGELTMEQALAHAASTGINYGIAVNCGQDFPIHTEAKLDSFFSTLTPEPVFYAMQAEGREWLDLFSPASRAQFDYVFTDAMTYTEDDGNRVHLWKPEEVHIADAEKFMDFYVEKITEVMKEPIDIFVNPTFLPEVIRDQYDELWTEERMEKVISAAIENDVVMEINCRYRIPSYTFLKKGKEMGLKFSCGTNNSNSEIGRQEYFINMIDSCGLVPADLFYPKL